jgi:hypothetical protein
MCSGHRLHQKKDLRRACKGPRASAVPRAIEHEPGCEGHCCKTLARRSDPRQELALVFHSANHDTVSYLKDNVPKRNMNGNVVITTRAQDAANQLVAVSGIKYAVMDLKQPSSEDAIELLWKSSDMSVVDTSNSVTVRGILDSVGCLPLAVDQAASYMKQSGCRAQEPLRMCRSEQMGEVMAWENNLSTHEQRFILAAYALAIEQFKEMSLVSMDLLQTPANICCIP